MKIDQRLCVVGKKVPDPQGMKDEYGAVLPATPVHAHLPRLL
jgi:hypothetical protein